MNRLDSYNNNPFFCDVIPSVEGFVMDHFCLFENSGRLLDTGDITLESPDRHSLHCLVDVGVCNRGPFYILGNAAAASATPYTVDYLLDDAGRQMLLDLARQAGEQGYCRTCTGDSTTGLAAGYRAEVVGQVTALGSDNDNSPVEIRVTSARTSNGLDDEVVCASFQESPGFDLAALLETLRRVLDLLMALIGSGGDGQESDGNGA